jgi:hypothetical protein
LFYFININITTRASTKNYHIIKKNHICISQNFDPITSPKNISYHEQRPKSYNESPGTNRIDIIMLSTATASKSLNPTIKQHMFIGGKDISVNL